MKYREQLDSGLSMDCVDCIDDILDDIENRVFDMLNSIREIEGLSEIDALKEDLDELYKDLY